MKQRYLFVFFLLALLSSPFLAQAQFVVDNNGDSGANSLRAAITQGNSTSAAYTISINVGGPISLTAALSRPMILSHPYRRKLSHLWISG